MPHLQPLARSNRRGPVRPERKPRKRPRVQKAGAHKLGAQMSRPPEDEEELRETGPRTLGQTKRLIHAAVRLWELRRGVVHWPTS